MKLRKYSIFWGVLYEGDGERTGEGDVKHSTMKERGGFRDHPQTQKAQRDCCIRVVVDEFQLYSIANFKRGEILKSNCSFSKVFPFSLALAICNVSNL